ncbi:hypothetical protein B0I35DRAFT_425961 [Stachybotrys elegans]|uniref:NACHT domain-containing protein n=1 Tax=Stachybotrys elegans TaxID=80388 RepID=A0A8K0WST1_9HYPO|nr:hypothetical protein B0I35DRAFT_425961 [Stachybotrys elegans]
MPRSFRWPFRNKDLKVSEAPKDYLPAQHNTPGNSNDTASENIADAPNPIDRNPQTETSPFGIKVLVDRDEEQRGCIDIIAIHGLNGHREKTWTNSATGLNWLSDKHCLQKEVPNARVLTFGYNSRTYFSRSDSYVQDFASDLLVALQANRRTHIEQQRPIVFICHSLGGIVFKQAVIKAHEQNNFFANILDNIRGVVFFATPHRGSDLATWDRIGTVLHKAGSLGYMTNTNLSKDLKVNAEFLKRVSESFVSRAGNFKIRSFYETEFMHGLACRVVERESATLGLTNELTVATPAHHANICKFESPSDARYKTAIFTIAEVAKSPEDELDRPFTLQEQDCMRGFNPDYELHLEQVDDPVPGTCEWVLSHEKWLQWAACAQSAILWISADAGCGKSVMAKFLVSHFQSHSNSPSSQNVYYFFFKDGFHGQDNATAAVSALLHQMCTSRKWLIEHVMPKYMSMSTQALHRFSSLWSILMSIVTSLTEDITLVLDGLDECDASLEDLLKAISAFITSTKGIPTQHRVGIILLSRPHNAIQQRLQFSGDSDKKSKHQGVGACNKIRLRVEEETASIARDISLFVKHKLVDLGQQDLLTNALLPRLERKLIRNADFTFLWISLIIQLVEDAGTDGISAIELESILNTTQLDDVYDRLLAGTPQPLKARKILMMILAAARPLSLEEMCAAVEVLQDHHPEEAKPVTAHTERASIPRPRVRKGKHKNSRRNQPETVKGFLTNSETRQGNHDPEQAAYDSVFDHPGKSLWESTVLQDTLSRKLPNQPRKIKLLNLEDLGMLLHKPFSNHLRRICGHFIRIRGRRIFLVHQTARQFLLGNFPESFGTGDLYSYIPDIGLMPSKLSADSVPQVTLKSIARDSWRHSINLLDAQRYLLQVCTDYIGLFQLDGDLKWTTELVKEYQGAHLNDPAWDFFDYATLHWINHYRPLRRSVRFCFDHLLNPSSPLFNVWIAAYPSWNDEMDDSGDSAIGVRIPETGSKWGIYDVEVELRRRRRNEKDAFKTRENDEPSEMTREKALQSISHYLKIRENDDDSTPQAIVEMELHRRRRKEEDASKTPENDKPREKTLQDILDYFVMDDFGGVTEYYDEEWLAGPRYWKGDNEQHGEDNDSGEDFGEDVNAEHSDYLRPKQPDRVTYFRKQYAEEYLKNWEELKTPMSGNPSSPFTDGTLTAHAMRGVGKSV